VTLQGDARRRFAARHAGDCWLWAKMRHLPPDMIWQTPRIRTEALSFKVVRHVPPRARFDE
jgi:hypothetical protein